MADDSGQQRSEAPTQRRRDDAQRKGQIAYSNDLASGLGLLAGTATIWLAGSTIGPALLDGFKLGFVFADVDRFDSSDASRLALQFGWSTATILAPIVVATFVTSLLVGSLQTGFGFSTDALSIKLERLSPLNGLTRLFSLRSTVRSLSSMVKLSLVVAAIAWVGLNRVDAVRHAGRSEFRSMLRTVIESTGLIFLAVAAALTLIGLLDYLYQRWQHEQDLMMTRQEVRDDQKQDEGDPQVRARIRKLQREASKNRMLKDVPSATVVLTNPTHLAIALRYDRNDMVAPTVVAKGAGLVAKRIAAIARENGVPVLERKPIARALYAGTEIGEEIPMELYHAVAEILSYLYRLRNAA